MTRIIATPTSGIAQLEEIADALDANPFDARDEDAFAAFAPRLKELANNRDFLTDRINSELSRYCVGQQSLNRYGAQVIMLHSGPSFAIRANIWPDAAHPLVRSNGMASFFYGLPHDHNVSFLTVGYAGSGYWSDYYEYDYDGVGGLPGDHAALRLIERSRLEQGKVQLYRAHKDVHCQIPPDDLSISLNIMESSPASVFLDQYVFDTTRDTVASYANPLPHDPLFSVAAAMRDPETMALLARVSATHSSTRVRFSALRALAAAAPTSDDRVAILERAMADKDHVLRGLARSRISEIEAARPWIEQIGISKYTQSCH
jgi:hypothetical protein